MTKRVTIIEVKDYVGQEVTIGAWVANKSGKGKIAFLQLRDGTAFFQGVAFKPNFIEKFGEEVGLALITGAGFGAPENVRLSYATDLDTLKEAIRRLHQFMEK